MLLHLLHLDTSSPYLGRLRTKHTLSSDVQYVQRPGDECSSPTSMHFHATRFDMLLLAFESLLLERDIVHAATRKEMFRRVWSSPLLAQTIYQFLHTTHHNFHAICDMHEERGKVSSNQLLQNNC